MIERTITFPILDKEILFSLEAGEMLSINGRIYTARDQAHRKMLELLKRGEKLPISLENNAIYYCGPTPPQKDNLFGSAGPTTSSRMDEAFLVLAEYGLSATIGKGERAKEVVEMCRKMGCVYFITFGGAGAYLAKRILSQKLIAFPELGAEAIYELVVRDFPVIVGIDTKGRKF
ncbi:MAG: FumA C-terminus/TtdB family hydratase beta subunit [Brevinematia bacterium]